MRYREEVSLRIVRPQEVGYLTLTVTEPSPWSPTTHTHTQGGGAAVQEVAKPDVGGRNTIPQHHGLQ